MQYALNYSGTRFLSAENQKLINVVVDSVLKQCDYSVIQSAVLTGFRTDFTSSLRNFCRRVADVPLREMSPVARSGEERLFSQATSTVEPLYLVLGFILRHP